MEIAKSLLDGTVGSKVESLENLCIFSFECGEREHEKHPQRETVATLSVQSKASAHEETWSVEKQPGKRNLLDP